jgi:hypothetical protein
MTGVPQQAGEPGVAETFLACRHSFHLVLSASLPADLDVPIVG